MARVQSSPFDIGAGGAPLGQLKTTNRNLTALGALPVRLPLRKKVGLFNLTWMNIAAVSGTMLGIQWFDNLHVGLFTLFGGGVVYGNHTSLRNFAIAWAALAIWEHFQRLDEEKRGVEPHNFWQGDSRLGLTEFVPLKPKIIAIAVEPGLAFLCGAVLRRLGFSMLGWVIIASSLCFAFSEWRLSRQIIDHRRSRRDLEKEAQWEADLASESAGRNESGHNPEALRTDIDGLENDIRSRKQAEREAAQGGTL